MTDRWAAGLQAGEKRCEWTDMVVPGLRLRVTPSGEKTFAVVYRQGPRVRRLTLGRFPLLGLAEAREMARSTLAAVIQGADPAGDKQSARKAITWGDLVDTYRERHAAKKRSGREDERILSTYVPRAWAVRPAASIERSELRAVLDDVASRAPVMANRVHACIRRVFNFGVEWDLVTMNPCHRLPRPGGPEKSRDRVLNGEELQAVWTALDGLNVEPASFFRLLLLTAQRSGEVLSMRWEDVDLASGWWTVPAERSKNKKAHRVPLSPQAVAVLRSVPSLTEGSPLILPSRRGSESGHYENHWRALEGIRKTSGVDFRPHDLRRTVATFLTGDLGVSRLVVGRILNHAETGVTAIYDRASYDAEKRAALDAWAARLEAIVRGEAGPAKVVPLIA
jgi:integrase